MGWKTPLSVDDVLRCVNPIAPFTERGARQRDGSSESDGKPERNREDRYPAWFKRLPEVVGSTPVNVPDGKTPPREIEERDCVL
jgi:hypothetical protein